VSRIEQVFDKYEEWFRTRWCKEMDESPYSPFAKLRTVPARTRAALARDHAVPQSYRKLLEERGAGELTIADYGRTDAFALLEPTAVVRARRECISWLDAETRARARANQRIDVTKVFPFLVMPDGTTWVMYAGTPPLDRVFYLSHDWEQTEDIAEVFAGPLTTIEFWEHFFARSRKADPLNGSHEHRYGFGKR
jgi:hypothetical protein